MAYKGTMKGRFIPKNPEKYMGNANNIFGRSSWEFRLFKWLDSTPAVMRWASEEFSVPYISPLDNRVHQYFPDALVVYRDKSDQVRKEIIEVKPYKETVLGPKSSERDKLAWVVNQAKWKAASAFAQSQGMTFRVITEKSMFAQGQTRSK